MNTKRYLLITLATSAAMFLGCQNPGKEQPATVRVREEVAEWAELVGIGVQIKDPRSELAIKGAVAYLDAAEANGGTFTVSTLRDVLGRFKELQSTDARLGVLGGSAIVRRLGGGNIDLKTPDLLRAAALGLRDGLKRSTGVEPPGK